MFTALPASLAKFLAIIWLHILCSDLGIPEEYDKIIENSKQASAGAGCR